MKTFYFDGLLPEGYKAIKQIENVIEKNKYIIINHFGEITSTISCDENGYVEVIENFKNNTLIHKRVFSDIGEYEEEYKDKKTIKKSYSTTSYDLVEKYKGGQLGADNEPAILKSNLEGKIILEEWYEKTENIPLYGLKHRNNALINGNLKSLPARTVTNFDQKKVTIYFYQNDNLTDGIDGSPAIQEFDLDTNVLIRSVRMKNNNLYKGEKPTIEGIIEKKLYEIHDKDDLKTCHIKISDGNLSKTIEVKNGEIESSEIEIDFTNSTDEQIINNIKFLINNDPSKLLEIFKSISKESIKNKYSDKNNFNNLKNNDIDKKKFNKKSIKKNFEEGEEYGVI